MFHVFSGVARHQDLRRRESLKFCPRTVGTVTPCRQAIFEGEGESGNLLSPTANIEGTVRKVTPRTSLWSVLRQQAVYESC